MSAAAGSPLPGERPALVIGATGFVGGAVLDQLIADRRPVRALARPGPAADALRGRGVATIPGDVLDPGSLDRAMDGCGVVYHAAGVNAFCLPDPSLMAEVNIDGSVNVIAAAARAGVGRVVYTSSAAALGEAAGTVGTEQSAHRGWFLSEYERTKYLAEKRVLAEAASAGVPVVCVSPSSVQGPGRVRGTARLLLQYANGRLKYLIDTRISFLDIADCTAGHLLAQEHGVPGERYVLNGATFTTRELISMVGKETGIEHPVRWLPGRAALAASAVIEAGAKVARRHPPLCREMMRTMLHGHTYDGSRAERDLGLHYTPVAQTIARTLRWYADHGYLARPLSSGGHSAPS
ncbi:MAG: NAD-dependent epimerase/dehydratase family protein [Streptosporangiaceae bacterium]